IDEEVVVEVGGLLVAAAEPGAHQRPGTAIQRPSFGALFAGAPGLAALRAIEPRQIAAAAERGPDDAVRIDVDAARSRAGLRRRIRLERSAGGVVANEAAAEVERIARVTAGLREPHAMVDGIRNDAVVECNERRIRLAVAVAVDDDLRRTLRARERLGFRG